MLIFSTSVLNVTDSNAGLFSNAEIPMLCNFFGKEIPFKPALLQNE